MAAVVPEAVSNPSHVVVVLVPVALVHERFAGLKDPVPKLVA